MPKRAAIVLAFASPCLNACGDTPGEVELPADPGQLGCNLPVEYMVSSSVGRDGIPSLQDPEFVSAEPSPQTAYLREDDRVLGFFLDGQPRAVPHNILWYHEIVNLDAGSERIAVTYCPLTGSPLGFDRTSIGGHTLGMYNRGSPESFWPQMFAEARCGAEVGRPLGRIPVFEMEWQGSSDRCIRSRARSWSSEPIPSGELWTRRRRPPGASPARDGTGSSPVCG